MRTAHSTLVTRLSALAGPLAVVVTAVLGLGVPLAVSSLIASGPPVASPALPPLDMTMVAKGQQHFWSTCVACHGADAKGVANLGRDLTSGFAFNAGDEELVALIMRGRQPGEKGHTAAVPMPPKGGHAEFTRDDIRMIVAYLRGLQSPTRLTGPMPSLVAVAAAGTPSVGSANAPIPAPEGMPELKFSFEAAAAERGKKVFNSCIACHTKTGAGMPNLGANLLNSQFIAHTNDADLVAFIKRGRQPSDPGSRMHLSMPARGGNPSLKDEQLADVVAYLRLLQANASAAK